MKTGVGLSRVGTQRSGNRWSSLFPLSAFLGLQSVIGLDGCSGKGGGARVVIHGDTVKSGV